jgi:hypothetical protein
MMETTVFKNVLVKHDHLRIHGVTINGTDLAEMIRSGFTSIQINLPITRPDQANVIFPEQYAQIFDTIFSVVDELYRSGQGCLAGFLSTFLFDNMTPFWMELLKAGRHILAVQLWRKVLSLAHAWEKRTGVHVHKGSPYAFIAYTYLMMGDIDTGFSYIYNAVEEDKKLNDVCPEISYPKNAPVYLTATLNPCRQNVMYPLVSEIRSVLEDHLDSYRREFGSSLSMDDLDRRFLQNPDLEVIVYFFVFTFWGIFEHQRKVDHDLMQNDFSKLKNANWLFALCLVIDKLFHSHPRYSDWFIGSEMVKYVVHKGLMAKDDLNNLRDQTKVREASPDQLIPKLLSLSVIYSGAPVKKEIQYLFVAWNLRNFAGHNIEIQNIVANNFEGIVRVLLYDIFLIIEEY